MSDKSTMNQFERTRVTVMQSLKAHKVTQQEAAVRLGLGIRQVKRLWRLFQAEGANGLISKQRGRVSPRRLDAELCSQAVELIRTRYIDFGPTLAHEKLTEIDHLKLSVESVRQLMIERQLWQPHHPKHVTIHPLRERRASFGELVQIDGSPFDWFEGRAPKCSLLVFIDDATGRLVELFFAPQESTFAYAAAMGRYFKRYGKPLAFYSDKHSIFRVTAPEAVSGTGLTQLGRALQELDIEILCANSPQAKGRVKRAHQTLQDRLVKELRLLGISTIDAANQYLPEYAPTLMGILRLSRATRMIGIGRLKRPRIWTAFSPIRRRARCPRISPCNTTKSCIKSKPSARVMPYATRLFWFLKSPMATSRWNTKAAS